jgi:hypothetical protein
LFWGWLLKKILQHGVTALFLAFSIDGIGKPDVGTLLSDPIMVALNCIVMGFFVWGFWDIWKLRIGGLRLAIIFSFFDIIAEFVFHGFVFITISVTVAIFLISFAFTARTLLKNNEKASSPFSQRICRSSKSGKLANRKLNCGFNAICLSIGCSLWFFLSRDIHEYFGIRMKT